MSKRFILSVNYSFAGQVWNNIELEEGEVELCKNRTVPLGKCLI